MTDYNAETYLDLIRKIAHSFHRTTGLEFDELYGEGCLMFTRAVQTHNPDRGRFTTHLTYVVKNHLCNYVQNEYQYFHMVKDSMPVEDCKTTTKPTQLRLAGFQEQLNRLSKEGRGVCELIFKAPGKYSARRVIYHALRERGWTHLKIRKGIQDIKLILKENPV